MATGAISNGSGLLQSASPAQVTESELASAVARAAVENSKPALVGLAAHVNKCWEEARYAKSAIVGRLLDAQRARMGRYDPAMMSNIKSFGGSEEYARITDNKCRVAEGWLRDVYLGQTDEPWTIAPTPSPDIPPDVTQSIKKQLGEELAQIYVVSGGMPTPKMVQVASSEMLDDQKQRIDDAARKTADRMEQKIADQMEEGGFHKAMADFLTDLVTYPSAHFKAPVFRKQKRLKWVKSGTSWKPEITETTVPQFERVDPFRIFPAPGIVNPQEGYIIEWLQYSRSDIYDLIGLDGFSEDAIRAVLDEYGVSGLKNWLGFAEETERDLIVDAGTTSSVNATSMIDCLEFHGPVQGKDLLDWGLTGKDGVTDPDKDYQACIWLIGRWVIKAMINPDPLGRRSYYKASYEEIPGSYWGLGIPDLLADVQGVVNATVRALINNMGMASGPQVGVNVDRLPAGEDLTTMHPWKLWQFEDSEYGNNASPPIQFFQPVSTVNDLLQVLERFYQFADDFSLIPRVMSGNDRISGPGRTASGTSMLLSAANKGLKGVVGNIDLSVMAPMLQALYNFNMLNDPDETIKGDCQIVARGAVSLMQLESLQLRRNEFLASTANPIDQQIIGPAGRAEVLREVAKGLELDTTLIVPSRDQLQAQQAQQTAAPPQGAAPPPAANAEQLANGQAVTDNFAPRQLASTG